jgi:DNA-binding PadR family transcriptional regulator
MAKKILPRKRLNPILSNRDTSILAFLWRYRIATFRAIKTVFFSHASNQQAYYELRRLRRGEYVNVEKIEGTRKVVWTLGTRGFKYLAANVLPELKIKAFRPQSHYHDLLVAAALTGSWLNKAPGAVQMVTEQELRALYLSSIPRELTKDEKHKPDGLWIFSSGKERKAIALEVETSAKTDERYEHIAAFYTSELFFESVVWVVKDKALGRRIHAASEKYGRPRAGLHLFLLQEDMEKHGWDSEFLNQSMGEESLGEYLNRRAGSGTTGAIKQGITRESPTNHPGIPREEIDPFLDFRVSLENLSTLR